MSMKTKLIPGTRVRYRWGRSKKTGRIRWRIGRFISSDGAYNWFQAGPGKFNPDARNQVELYPNEFFIIL